MFSDKGISIIASAVSVLGAVVVVTLAYAALDGRIKDLERDVRELKKPSPLDQKCADLVDQAVGATKGGAWQAVGQFQADMVSAGCKQR